MTRLADRLDYLERPDRLITGITWEVPPIELRGDRWLVGLRQEELRLAVVPRGGLLRRFCGLEKAAPGRILAFARKYGLLFLCRQHGLPQWHESGCGARVFDKKDAEQCDDVAQWREWARRFAGTAGLARSILSGRGARPDDVDAVFLGFDDRWEQIADILRRPAWMDGPMYEVKRDGRQVLKAARPWKAESLDVQIFNLRLWLNWLLLTSRVTRSVVRVGRSSALAVVDGYSPGAPLFGLLVSELAAACADVQTLARCKHCQRGFRPSRTSAEYCPKCRSPRIRWRLAQQSRRARLRHKQ